MTRGRYNHEMTNCRGASPYMSRSPNEDLNGRAKMLTRLECALMMLEIQTKEEVKTKSLVSRLLRKRLDYYTLFIFPHNQIKQAVSQRINLVRDEAHMRHLLRYAITQKNSEGYNIQLADPLISQIQ